MAKYMGDSVLAKCAHSHERSACSSCSSRGSGLGIRLGREELNIMLRGQRRHFRGISEPVDFFK